MTEEQLAKIEADVAQYEALWLANNKYGASVYMEAHGELWAEAIPPLVAEVRRLRAALEDVLFHAKHGGIDNMDKYRWSAVRAAICKALNIVPETPATDHVTVSGAEPRENALS